MTIYDRTVARFSRRELMKIGWTLGAAAVAQPFLARRLLAKPIFESYPFSLGVASGDPLPDGIVLWTRLAPKPLEGGGMPMNIVEVGWEIARDRRFQNDRAAGHRAGAARARTQRARRGRAGSSLDASTGTGSTPATK